MIDPSNVSIAIMTPSNRNPHFLFPYDEATKQYIGEDRYFTNLIRTHGTNVYIDHTVSHAVGHIGDFNYCYDSMRHKNGPA